MRSDLRHQFANADATILSQREGFSSLSLASLCVGTSRFHPLVAVPTHFFFHPSHTPE